MGASFQKEVYKFIRSIEPVGKHMVSRTQRLQKGVKYFLGISRLRVICWSVVGVAAEVYKQIDDVTGHGITQSKCLYVILGRFARVELLVKPDSSPSNNHLIHTDANARVEGVVEVDDQSVDEGRNLVSSFGIRFSRMQHGVEDGFEALSLFK